MKRGVHAGVTHAQNRNDFIAWIHMRPASISGSKQQSLRHRLDIPFLQCDLSQSFFLLRHWHCRGDLPVGSVVLTPERGHCLGLGIERDALLRGENKRGGRFKKGSGVSKSNCRGHIFFTLLLLLPTKPAKYISYIQGVQAADVEAPQVSNAKTQTNNNRGKHCAVSCTQQQHVFHIPV